MFIPEPTFLSPAGFVDQTLPLDEDGAALLSDTFDVLSLKELKLSAASAAEGADEPQDEQAILVKTMQKKLISHVRATWTSGCPLGVQFHWVV